MNKIEVIRSFLLTSFVCQTMSLYPVSAIADVAVTQEALVWDDLFTTTVDAKQSPQSEIIVLARKPKDSRDTEADLCRARLDLCQARAESACRNRVDAESCENQKKDECHATYQTCLWKIEHPSTVTVPPGRSGTKAKPTPTKPLQMR